MAQETPTKSRRRRRNGKPEEEERKSKTSRRRGNGSAEHDAAEPEAAEQEAAEQEQDQDFDDEQRGGDEGGKRTVTSELKEVVRDSAIEVLKPVAKKATTQAAKYAVTKGPELFKSGVMDKVGEAGGPKALAMGAAEKGGELMAKVKGDGDGGGDDKPEGVGKGRRLPVQEYVDVGVPIDTAYNQWTQFEDFPKFMHRVEKLEQRDDTHLMWTEKIWGVRRQWEAEITEQRPNRRIAWKSLDGTTNAGVVTFHELSDNLTRVQVNLDFQPHGLFEKTASGFRMSRRALKSDLMRFKAFIEMRDDETGEWRGEVEDGDVTSSEQDESQETEGREDDETRGESDDEPQADASEDDYDDEDEEYEDDEDDEPSMSEDEDRGGESEGDDEDADEEPERKKPRRRAKTRS